MRRSGSHASQSPRPRARLRNRGAKEGRLPGIETRDGKAPRKSKPARNARIDVTMVLAETISLSLQQVKTERRKHLASPWWAACPARQQWAEESKSGPGVAASGALLQQPALFLQTFRPEEGKDHQIHWSLLLEPHLQSGNKKRFDFPMCPRLKGNNRRTRGEAMDARQARCEHTSLTSEAGSWARTELCPGSITTSPWGHLIC